MAAMPPKDTHGTMNGAEAGAEQPDTSSARALPDAVPARDDSNRERERLHLRRIEMSGYRRQDGLYEVEGRVIDCKSCDHTPVSGGRQVAAGEPVHDMWVRLVFDGRLVVHDVEARTMAAPYPMCPEAAGAMQAIRGLRMTTGWSAEVRQRLGGVRGCTHLMELLMPMATTAHQTLGGEPRRGPDPTDAAGRPLKIDSCYAYAAERELVRLRWPQHHRQDTRND